MRKFKIITSLGVILSLLAVLFGPPYQEASATLSDMFDVMSRLAASDGTQVLSNHTIMFETSVGVASTQTIVITFPSDFDGTTDGQGTLDYTDVDLWEDTSPDDNCDNDGVSETLVSGSPGTSEWSAVFSGTASRILTFNSEVCVEIGENAAGGSSNSQYENPTTTGNKTIQLAVGPSETGNIVVNILTNEQVVATATVLASLTFSVDDNTVEFGTLSTTAARWANDSGGSSSAVAAHTMQVGTNSPGGYSVKYNGTTLTSTGTPADTISVATITGDEDGTPGSEQFAIGLTTNGDATIVTTYAKASNNYKFVASTETEIVYENNASATETLSVYYIANIAANTEAHTDYTSTVTYTGTGNF